MRKLRIFVATCAVTALWITCGVSHPRTVRFVGVELTDNYPSTTVGLDEVGVGVGTPLRATNGLEQDGLCGPILLRKLNRCDSGLCFGHSDCYLSLSVSYVGADCVFVQPHPTEAPAIARQTSQPDPLKTDFNFVTMFVSIVTMMTSGFSGILEAGGVGNPGEADPASRRRSLVCYGGASGGWFPQGWSAVAP